MYFKLYHKAASTNNFECLRLSFHQLALKTQYVNIALFAHLNRNLIGVHVSIDVYI